MQVFVPCETTAGETRIPLLPDTVARLARKEIPVTVESGIGERCGFQNSEYEEAGASVSSNRRKSLAEADMVLRLHKPPKAEIGKMKEGSIHVSFLDPFHEEALVDAFAKAGVSAVSIEMIPRTTLAQKMDALSSQANLAGYVAVILGAARLPLAMPMMMTPAGTLKPARVFVIGAGVAGLQAIATAKRLGARVEAFDTRPVVEEQVQSLGARFVKVDLGETGQTKDGYAQELTAEQQAKQREAMANVCAQADLVVTTAKLFGKPAPVIITDDIIKRMRPGSVIVDLAVETGGNVEGSKLGEEVEVHGVQVLGYGNFEGRVPLHASQMYSSNLGNFLEHYWDEEKKEFDLDLSDEIIQGCLITHNGAIVNPVIKNLRGGKEE
jgi:NAD(P) transhydrogenase subunit alpha